MFVTLLVSKLLTSKFRRLKQPENIPPKLAALLTLKPVKSNTFQFFTTKEHCGQIRYILCVKTAQIQRFQVFTIH